MVRERVYRYAPSNYQLNKKIKKMQQQAELKYSDSLTDLIITNDPNEALSKQNFLLNDIAIGPSQLNNRIGAEVRNTSIQYRGNIYIQHLNHLIPPPGNLDTYDYGKPMVRMIVYWDSSPNGQGHDIFGSPALAGSESLLDNGMAGENIFCPYNMSTVGAGRFKILKDKTYTFNRDQPLVSLDPTTAPSTTTWYNTFPNMFIQGKIKLSRVTTYTGPTASINAISTNALYVLFISNYNGTQAAKPRLYMSGEVQWRLFFKDD